MLLSGLQHKASTRQEGVEKERGGQSLFGLILWKETDEKLKWGAEVLLSPVSHGHIHFPEN